MPDFREPQPIKVKVVYKALKKWKEEKERKKRIKRGEPVRVSKKMKENRMQLVACRPSANHLKKEHNNIMTVDPGDTSAIAFWKRESKEKRTFKKNDLVPIVQQWSINDNIIVKTPLLYMASTFRYHLINYKPKKVYIEDAVVWGNSAKSQASMKSGRLSKLIRLIGVYEYLCEMQSTPVELIKPQTWKGQLPNEEIEKWIIEINGRQYTSEHLCCAVGIGLYLNGDLR